MIPQISQAPGVVQLVLNFLQALEQQGFTGDTATSYADRLTMATDNSIYQLLPDAVVFPRSTADVALIARLASQERFSTLVFTPRGGGTGTNGQALNQGIIIDMSRYMNRIIEINPEEGWVRVEAGVIKDQLNQYLKPYGYFFAPELSTSNRATLGGMINTDASGQGSLVYGKTSDHVLGVRAVLLGGDILDTQPMPVELAETLGKVQPFRYRGYVYDEETGLYYLRNRFYNAHNSRCISADSMLSTRGTHTSANAYAYSRNAPTIRADANGQDSIYVIYDSRPNATDEHPEYKGLTLQGEWAINALRENGHYVMPAGFTNIPEFIAAWNNAGAYEYDYIIIYAHGSPGTIDCAGGYLKETTESGEDANGNHCYSSINELKEIRVNKGIYLLSCNGATPNSEYMTAIGMLSSKAGGAPTMGSAYASVNYYEGTGIPYQSPGLKWSNGLSKNFSNLMNWLYASCWVTFSKDGMWID